MTAWQLLPVRRGWQAVGGLAAACEAATSLQEYKLKLGNSGQRLNRVSGSALQMFDHGCLGRIKLTAPSIRFVAVACLQPRARTRVPLN